MARGTYSPSEVFGAKLRELRKHQGLTRHQLAERMTGEHGVTRQRWTIERIESGTRRVRLEEVDEFAGALDVPAIALLEPWHWGDTEVS